MSNKVGYQTLSICLLNWHPLWKGGKIDKQLIKIKMCTSFDFRLTGFSSDLKWIISLKQNIQGEEYDEKLRALSDILSCGITVRERATLKI